MGKKIISELKDKYFNNTTQIIRLKKGEVLMKQNDENKRLFLVLEGLITGLLHGEGETVEVFRSGEDMLVGVHSFFSLTFVAYAEVSALEDSKLAYISYEDEIVRPYEFLEDFLPEIVNELFERQVFAKRLMQEKENALIQNHHRDKLATLGQMAAGIAHELNNAIGIMNGNAEWIAKEIYDYVKEKESPRVFANFEKGYDKGQYLSSMEVRKKKKLIEQQLHLSGAAAKKLARLDLEESYLKNLRSEQEINDLTDLVYNFWEMGVAIHDILLASKHAVNVIAAVKALGISEREHADVDINRTLEEALTLVKKQSEGIKIKFDPKDLPIIQANSTEMVQIWVNLIKNACESLKNAQIENPKIKVESGNEGGEIRVLISDNGPGIPEKLKEKIFQPNFTTKKGGLSFGLGLGLPVVQKHINQHKGSIKVESKPGKTVFCVNLPIK